MPLILNGNSHCGGSCAESVHARRIRAHPTRAFCRAAGAAQNRSGIHLRQRVPRAVQAAGAGRSGNLSIGTPCTRQ